jgi:hypothetical protein
VPEQRAIFRKLAVWFYGDEMNQELVTLHAPKILHSELRIKGTSALICHRWSEKAKKEMLDKQMKKATKGREAKDPQRDYEDSLYKLPDGKFGFPSIAFKAAIVRAGTYSEMKMTYLRGAFHIVGEMVEIEGTPRMREDMVRVGMGTADIRYRGEFPEWQAVLHIAYNAASISLEQIANLLMVAGFAVGVGEWRPEKDGQFGTFEVI